VKTNFQAPTDETADFLSLKAKGEAIGATASTTGKDHSKSSSPVGADFIASPRSHSPLKITGHLANTLSSRSSPAMISRSIMAKWPTVIKLIAMVLYQQAFNKYRDSGDLSGPGEYI
jgi:hypothetical protein